MKATKSTLPRRSVTETMHPVEGLADGAAHHQSIMVAQNQGLAGTQVAHERFLLGQIEHHATVIVISNFQETHRGLGDRQQAAL